MHQHDHRTPEQVEAQGRADMERALGRSAGEQVTAIDPRPAPPGSTWMTDDELTRKFLGTGGDVPPPGYKARLHLTDKTVALARVYRDTLRACPEATRAINMLQEGLLLARHVLAMYGPRN